MRMIFLSEAMLNCLFANCSSGRLDIVDWSLDKVL